MQQRTNSGSVMPYALVDTATLLNMISVSRITIWRWVKAGQFPAPAKLLNGRNYWYGRDVEDWLNTGN